MNNIIRKQDGIQYQNRVSIHEDHRVLFVKLTKKYSVSSDDCFLIEGDVVC